MTTVSSVPAVLLAAFACCTARAKPMGSVVPKISDDQRIGSWVWSHHSEAADRRIEETETWQLAGQGRDVSGWYQRKIVVISTDGIPFTCNQQTSYTLLTTYVLSGRRMAPDNILLSEVDAIVAPNPCDAGTRPLRSYAATLQGYAMHLRHDDFVQVLTAAEPRDAEPPVATELQGRWHWSRQHVDRAVTTIEREEMRLEENGDQISGILSRTVTVLNNDGTTIPCAQNSAYSITSEFSLIGRLVGDQITLLETSAQIESHPCAQSPEPILDGARGRIIAGDLVLEWRGKLKQVLRRPRPG